ncbi:MAG: retroviral-like aspartic protease family protein [Betaproteobacteria bacterium]
MRLLLALGITVGLLNSIGASAQAGKCKFVLIVDWQVRMVRNQIVVDGAISGQKIGIVLDTGAQSSLILRSSAARLGLSTKEVRGRRMIGVGGESQIEIATVDDFKLGEVSTKDMQLYVSGEREFTDGTDVLLGENFLRNFDVEFDLKNHAVRLYQARDCEGVTLAYWTKEVVGEVEIKPVEELRPVISFKVHVNDRPFDAILDSGASTSVFSQDDAASLGVTPETPGVVAGAPARGLGAKAVSMWTGTFKSFAIGNEDIPDIRIRFADLFKDATYAETGSRITRRSAHAQPMLLGADFLLAHRMLVAHSQRKLYFTYAGGPVFRVDALPPAPAARPAGGVDAKSGGAAPP